MSASIDPEFAKLAQQAASDQGWQDAAKKVAEASQGDRFWSDVGRFAPLGAAAMVARTLLAEQRPSIGWLIRWSVSASVTSVLVGFASQDYIHSEGLRYAATGISGAFAPELLDYALRYLKAKGDAKMREVGAAPPKAKRKKR